MTPDQVQRARVVIADHLQIPVADVTHMAVQDGPGYFTVPRVLTTADQAELRMLLVGYPAEVRPTRITTDTGPELAVRAVPYARRVVVRVEMSDGTWTEAVLTREDPEHNPVPALAVLIDPGFPDPEIRPNQLTLVNPAMVKPTGYKVDVRGADHLVVRSGHDG